MKKIYNKILLVLIALIILPAASLLVGCGATPVNQAQGVSFVSNVQDDEGIPVFELDLGLPVRLPYKLNPSSAYGYSPRFTAIKGIDGDNLERFSLDRTTGEFCIKKADFNNVKVEVAIGDSYKAECWIKLKKYPTAIGLYDENEFNGINASPKINLSSGASFQINVAAIFADSEVINQDTGEKKPSLISDSDYNFLVEADENSKTIINVPSSNRLNIMAYNNYGTAKVKVALCNYYGEVIKGDDGVAKLAFEIEIETYMICDSMEVNLSSANKLVSSKNQIESLYLKASNLEYDSSNGVFILEYSVDFYDRFDRLIQDAELKSTCFVDKTTYIQIDNINNKIFVSRPPSGGMLDFNLEIWSNAPLVTGEFCMIEINIKLTF